MTAPTAHKLSVNVDPASLAPLADSGTNLYFFLGFETSNRSCVPLVFEAVTQWSETVSFAWTETYKGFLSSASLAAGKADFAKRTIGAQSSAPVEPGQTLTVASDILEFTTARTAGSAGAITFRNGGSKAVTCGLSYGDSFSPVCAAALFPNLDVVVAPAQIAFLMLSSSQFDVGAWVTASMGTGLRVDMAGAEARSVPFSLSGGWTTAESWAEIQPAGTALTDILRLTPRRNVPRL